MAALRNYKRKASSKLKKRMADMNGDDEDDEEFNAKGEEVGDFVLSAIDGKKKIAPRSGLQFKVGPSFDHAIVTHKVFTTSSSQQIFPIIHSRIDRGFEHSNGEWIGYKRNYFTLVASFEVEQMDLNEFINDEFFIVNEFQERVKISYFALRLVSVCSEDGSTINLVQHTAKRDRGPQFAPPLYPAVPGRLPDHTIVKEAANVRNGSKIEKINRIFYFDRDQHYNESTSIRSSFLDKYPADKISKVARYERIQFSSSINYRKPASNNRHFTLKVELMGILDNGSQVCLAFSETPPLVIRGRSPSNYQGSSKAGSKALEKLNSKVKKASKSHIGSVKIKSKNTGKPILDVTLDEDQHSDAEGVNTSMEIALQIKKQIARFNEEYAENDGDNDISEPKTPTNEDFLPAGLHLLPFDMSENPAVDVSEMSLSPRIFVDSLDKVKQSGLKKSKLKSSKRKKKHHHTKSEEQNFNNFGGNVDPEATRKGKKSKKHKKVKESDILSPFIMSNQFSQFGVLPDQSLYIHNDDLFYGQLNQINECSNSNMVSASDPNFEFDINNIIPPDSFEFPADKSFNQYEKEMTNFRSKMSDMENIYDEGGLADVSMTMPSALLYNLDDGFDHSKFLVDF